MRCEKFEDEFKVVLVLLYVFGQTFQSILHLVPIERRNLHGSLSALAIENDKDRATTRVPHDTNGSKSCLYKVLAERSVMSSSLCKLHQHFLDRSPFQRSQTSR